MSTYRKTAGEWENQDCYTDNHFICSKKGSKLIFKACIDIRSIKFMQLFIKNKTA